MRAISWGKRKNVARKGSGKSCHHVSNDKIKGDRIGKPNFLSVTKMSIVSNCGLEQILLENQLNLFKPFPWYKKSRTF